MRHVADLQLHLLGMGGRGGSEARCEASADGLEEGSTVDGGHLSPPLRWGRLRWRAEGIALRAGRRKTKNPAQRRLRRSRLLSGTVVGNTGVEAPNLFL